MAELREGGRGSDSRTNKCFVSLDLSSLLVTGQCRKHVSAQLWCQVTWSALANGGEIFLLVSHQLTDWTHPALTTLLDEVEDQI